MHLSKTVSAVNPFIVRLPLSEPKRGHNVWSATVAFEQREDGIYTGVSLRSPKDVYDGALGERIAVGRARDSKSWYATWDMLPEEVQVPDMPVALYRLRAQELAYWFINNNIHRNDHMDAFHDLNIPSEFNSNYTEWFRQKEIKVIQYVYGN